MTKNDHMLEGLKRDLHKLKIENERLRIENKNGIEGG